MINLIRGQVESRITDEVINSMDDYAFLVSNNELNINSKDLVLQNILKLEKDLDDSVNINVYFTKYTAKEDALVKDFNISIRNYENVEGIDFTIINKLKDMTDVEKINIATSLMRDEEDALLINEAINNSTLTLNSLIRKLVVKYA